MGSHIPKQYLRIQGRTILEHTLVRLLDVIDEVVLALAPDDRTWAGLPLAQDSRIRVVNGGPTRRASVLAALNHLRGRYGADEPIMVHDAVRPCLPREDLYRLLDMVAGRPEGGLLALPIVDTVKKATPGEPPSVDQTIERGLLYRAQTPQVFRLGLLLSALESAADEEGVTDESSAVERLGVKPLLVIGSTINIKITYPDDLKLAEAILARDAQP